MMTFLRLSAGYLFFLLFVSAGCPAPADPIVKIIAFANETAILPCHIDPSDDLPTVEWSKENISPNITFLYRGCETFAEKNPLFRDRTNIQLDKVKDGDLSQIIHDVRLSDAGVYRCLTRTERQVQVEATLELFVVAVSKPKLTFVPADDGVMLQCTAECWFPEPQVQFLDDRGSEIEAKESQRVEDPTGCFTITRTVALKVDTSSVTCKVQETQSNVTRKTHLHIPGSCMSSCTNACVITGAVTFVVTGVCVLLMLCGNAVCGCWIKKLAKEQTIYNLNAEISYFTSKLEPAPQRGQPPSTSISTPPSTNQEDQLPQSITLKPAASSTSIHRESDHKSKVKDSQQAVPKHPAPGPKVKENNPKSAAFPFPKGGAAPSSPHPPPIPEGSTCSRSLSFSGPYSSSGRLLRRPSMSNRYSVLVNLTEDKESLLK
ncbi:V-set domain containing T-cell activation inhibitor 1 [Nothobranchius furzeri]|uniref:Butyrophilin subfamily 3 member A2-like n=2 Tax=Nothobranchius furzeri TaxID=105023 RepID=A0A9D2YZK9_NOTFU|nr:butyrophilin subfamily 3 member A2-like [Nothobranchius furzeri]